MNVEFKLPNLGEGVEAADVAELLVKAGDTVTKDQPVAELETEKAVMELQCPHAGTIKTVHFSEGDSLRVGQLLLTIETTAAAPTEAPAKADAPAAAKPAGSSAAPEASAPKASAPAAPTSSGGALFEFQLPALGEGVEKADVAEVLVKAGDMITAGQAVLELETEKAVMEVPCPQAGTIQEILVKPGDSVKVGQKVLKVQSSGAAAAAQPATPAAAPAKPAAPSASASSAKPAAASTAPAKSTAVAELVEPNGNGDGTPVPAAPSTRRLARKLGVELRSVQGTGSGGRITQEDVEDHVRNRLAQQTLPAVSRGGGRTLAAGSLAPPPLPDFSRYGLVEREAMGKIARTAAENLTVSWNVIPHVTQHDRTDITDLEAARKRFGSGLGKNGPKVTMTAVAMKALTTCLQAYPKFNSSLDPETNEIVYKKYYNIGCAVDTPNGLLVPVVKDCDKKSILEIAASITDLAAKARDRKLSMDDMQGATCTVTNLGGIGGTAFTPIVNYPEVCILGMARSQMELQMIDGQIKERMMLPLALSYDHRVINGADAARFVATLCQMLSDPFQLLSAI
jgi:pyruvate dehydrogenase E2 component (dihydrolipoamide acetyltransferase)